MSDPNTLIELYRKFDAEFRRQTAASERAATKAEQAKYARDGIRAAMQMEGVWDTFQQNEQTQSAVTRRVSRGGTNNLTSAIRSVLSQFTDNFTIHQVIRSVKEINPDLVDGKDASVSSALRRLTTEGILELIAKGAGKRPSIYRVVSNGGPDTPNAPSSEEGLPT